VECGLNDCGMMLIARHALLEHAGGCVGEEIHS